MTTSSGAESRRSRFAAADEIAAELAERWRTADPYPEIPSALLNSGDVRDYVAATGLLWPFRDDDETLKPASYEVALLGTYVYFDQDGNRHSDEIRKNQPFALPPNSIAFVTLEPTFRLPEYIALRFNLRIDHVYKGLLLGTGPLVDPGFTGKLSIPLHNLTTNDYELVGGEGLIWVEFTKLSPAPATLKRPAGVPPPPERTREMVPLQPRKRDKDVFYYLRRAAGGRPVRSGIPKATADARAAAEAANLEIGRLRRRADIAAIAALATLAGLGLSVFGLLNGIGSRLDKPAVTREEYNELERRVAQFETSASHAAGASPTAPAATTPTATRRTASPSPSPTP